MEAKEYYGKEESSQFLNLEPINITATSKGGEWLLRNNTYSRFALLTNDKFVGKDSNTGEWYIISDKGIKKDKL